MRLHIGLVVLLAACSNNVSSYTGDYTVSVTSLAGGSCGLPNWTDGQVVDMVDVQVIQDPQDLAIANVIFGGAEGTYLDSIVGTHTVSGFVRDNGFSGQIFGSALLSGGPCSQPSSVSATITLVLDSDNKAVSGDISFAHVLPPCQTLCASDQSFSGQRN